MIILVLMSIEYDRYKRMMNEIIFIEIHYKIHTKPDNLIQSKTYIF